MFCVVSNGELWKLCEQKHSGHYLADGTLLMQKCLLTLCVCVCVHACFLAQLCLTLWDPMSL